MSVCLWVGGEGRLVWAVFSGDERKCEPRSGEQGLSVYKGGLVWGEQVALIARRKMGSVFFLRAEGEQSFLGLGDDGAP
jgi:hypothetical protein